MDPKNERQQVGNSDFSIPKMNPKIDVGEAMKKQTNNALILAGEVINTQAKSSNLVISPASINLAITMFAADSKGNLDAVESISFQNYSSVDELKAVFQEISSVVSATSSSSDGPKLASANGVWIDKSLASDPEFEVLLENFFKAFYARVDFRSKGEEEREKVNAWVEDHTNGLIKNLLPPGSVTNLTNKIYGNALYFKGAWKRPFEKSCTRRRRFHLLNRKMVSVPFMTSNENQLISTYEGFKVLRLPYRQGRDDTKRQFSMYFYLPDMHDGLETLVDKISSTPGFLDSHIPSYRPDTGEFRIPKFKVEFGFSVTSVLPQLAQESISLYHKACVEIDEEGAEATAATAIMPYPTCSAYPRQPPAKIDFVADHPFLFLIREDNTGTVLFVGQIFDPSKSS